MRDQVRPDGIGVELGQRQREVLDVGVERLRAVDGRPIRAAALLEDFGIGEIDHGVLAHPEVHEAQLFAPPVDGAAENVAVEGSHRLQVTDPKNEVIKADGFELHGERQ